ncbi:hypothetical protein MTsPCn5_00370 [Croceitalea sp. MTPC5]|nr:hypothetical protein MTsPCn5_00370 [Croceitalea sp. MTPC5]
MKKVLKVALLVTRGRKAKLLLLGVHAAYTGYRLLRKKKTYKKT